MTEHPRHTAKNLCTHASVGGPLGAGATLAACGHVDDVHVRALLVALAFRGAFVNEYGMNHLTIDVFRVVVGAFKHGSRPKQGRLGVFGVLMCHRHGPRTFHTPPLLILDPVIHTLGLRLSLALCEPVAHIVKPNKFGSDTTLLLCVLLDSHGQVAEAGRDVCVDHLLVCLLHTRAAS